MKKQKAKANTKLEKQKCKTKAKAEEIVNFTFLVENCFFILPDHKPLALFFNHQCKKGSAQVFLLSSYYSEDLAFDDRENRESYSETSRIFKYQHLMAESLNYSRKKLHLRCST